MLTRIRPALALANWVSTHSLLLGDQMPMRSPGCKTERQQPRGQPVNFPLQPRISQPHFLVPHHERRAGRPFGAYGVEELPDRLADQRLIARTMDVTELEPGHCVSSNGFPPVY